IRHDNIAGLLDFDRDERGRPFFVMEYYCRTLELLLGGSEELKQRGRTLPPDRSAAIIGQVLDALDRLHQVGIVHRDVKPANVLFTDGGVVKLIDFGMSLLPGGVGRESIPKGLRIGTPSYTAPEQEEDPALAEERSDLYSCGVMAWRMLTGELPAEGGERQLPGDSNPLLGSAWDDFLVQATAHRIGDRFAGASEMARALDRALTSWRRHQETFCSLEQGGKQGAASRGEEKRLRSDSERVYAADARTVFGLDKLWRPLAGGTGSFSSRDGEVAVDSAHALTWQWSASPFPLSWAAAQEYVQHLEREGFAGRSGWRLPTISELSTLLRPKTEPGDLCLDPVFESVRTCLWSADTRSVKSAWMVETGSGFVAFQDKTCRCFVRAVTSGS
ncbi:MAG: protein kinase domain-containing protein, partial [Desulfohalobiaceae bacterium]